MKVAVLDDYQNVALKMADWGKLRGKAEITVFTGHAEGVDAGAKRLAPFDIVCCMRGRAPFKRDRVKKLTNVKLQITAGALDISVDLEARNGCGDADGQ